MIKLTEWLTKWSTDICRQKVSQSISQFACSSEVFFFECLYFKIKTVISYATVTLRCFITLAGVITGCPWPTTIAWLITVHRKTNFSASSAIVKKSFFWRPWRNCFLAIVVTIATATAFFCFSNDIYHYQIFWKALAYEGIWQFS